MTVAVFDPSMTLFPGVGMIISVVAISFALFTYRPLLLVGIIIGYAAFDQISFRYRTVFMFMGMNVRVMDVDIMAVLLITLLGFMSKTATLRLRGKLIGLYLLFVFIGAIGIARGLPAYGSLALGEARYYIFSSLLIPFFLVYVKGPRSAAYLLAATAIGAVIASFRDVFPMVVGQQAIERFNASYSMLAGSMGFLILLSAITGEYPNDSFLHKFKRYRSVFVLVLIALGLIIIIASHRSVWLSTATGMFTLLYVSKKRIRYIGALIVILLLTIFAFIVINKLTGGQSTAYVESKTDFIHGYKEDSTARWRVIMWQKEIENALETPILGRGFGNFAWNFDPSKQMWTKNWVHNQYIMLFSKIGLVGIFVYLSFWIGILARAVRLFQNSQGPIARTVLATATTCVTANLIYNMFYQETIFLWFFGGMILAISNYMPEMRKSSTREIRVGTK